MKRRFSAWASMKELNTPDQAQNQMVDDYLYSVLNKPQIAQELAKLEGDRGAAISQDLARIRPPEAPSELPDRPKPGSDYVIRCDDSWVRNPDGSIRLVRTNCRWEKL